MLYIRNFITALAALVLVRMTSIHLETYSMASKKCSFVKEDENGPIKSILYTSKISTTMVELSGIMSLLLIPPNY